MIGTDNVEGLQESKIPLNKSILLGDLEVKERVIIDNDK